MNARPTAPASDDPTLVGWTVEYALEREGDWCQVGQLWKRIPEIPLDQITPSLDRLRAEVEALRAAREQHAAELDRLRARVDELVVSHPVY